MEIAYGEVVGEGTPRQNRALDNTSRAVHMGGPVHEQTVEMQRGGLVTQAVLDIDNDPIAKVDVDSGNGPLAVDANDWSLERTVRVSLSPANVEIKLAGGRGGDIEEAKQRGCHADVPDEHCDEAHRV